MIKMAVRKGAGIAVLIVFSLLGSNFVLSSELSHWQYAGQHGPEKWGALDTAFDICSSGKNQSPINLTRMIEAELPEIELDYQVAGNQIINNGHTIQVNYMAQSFMSLSNQKFELKQFHFHSPSENIIEGKSYPLEAHFVHADENGQLAVVAVMFDLGKQNDELEKVWSQMPGEVNNKVDLKANISGQSLIGDELAYYRFNGSLTTPPCTEGVNWLVVKSANSISKEQLEKFTSLIKHPNNRPIQPINARVIVQ